MTAFRAEICAICHFGHARELTEPRATKAGAAYAWRGWHCDYCGEGYTDDEQGRANAEAERMAKDGSDLIADVMAETLGGICGRAVALGWKKPDAGRVEAASIIAELAQMRDPDRHLLEVYCRGLVAKAKGAL